MKKITDFSVGEKAELIKKITAEDIRKFVELTGDDNRIHLDMDFASKTTFRKPIAHGMLGASFISTLIGKKLPGDGAVWFSQSLEFHLPVKVNDTIKVMAEVSNVDVRNSSLELQIIIVNQYNQKVTTGKSKVKLVEFEKEKIVEKKESIPKIALVLGATGGIGEATCLYLASEGYKIIVHYYNNETAAKKLVNTINEKENLAIKVKADINSENDIKAMFEEINRYYDGVYYIVNCSTMPIPNINFEDLLWNDIDNQIKISIKGTFTLLKQFIPKMKQLRYGKIILLTTMATEQPNPKWLHYITAKSALNGFAKALATEMAPHGVRVNLISPGMTETNLISEIPKSIKTLTKAKTPLRRLATPEDVAYVIGFLFSEKSDYLVGETIRVNGGQSMI